MNKKISVIIPCYNCENYILPCLESVHNQSYSNLEVIIINDGSRDNSSSVIKSYIQDKENFYFIDQENQGVSRARNNGLKIASGDYVMFIDGDDYITDDYIKDFADVLHSNPDLVVGGFKYQYSNGNATVIDGISFEYCSKEEYINKYYIQSINRRLLFGPINKLYKTSIIKSNNIKFKENIHIREDGMFVLDYLNCVKTIIGISNSGYHYIQQAQGTSLVTRFNKEELNINSQYFHQILSFFNKIITSEIITQIYPIFLNMDYSSITKYYLSQEYNFKEGINYIQKVKKDVTYKNARQKLLKNNFNLGVKYYRPIIVIHFVNILKRRKVVKRHEK